MISGNGQVVLSWPNVIGWADLLGGPVSQAERRPEPCETAAPGVPQATGGDPVDLASGVFFEEATDMSTAGGRGPSLAMWRAYNADLASADGPLGHGWSWSYAMRLQLNGAGPDSVKLIEEGAGEATWNKSGAVYQASVPRMTAKLTRQANGSWTVVRCERDVLEFNSTGRLSALRDLNGYAVTFTYDGSGKLVTATDAAGRAYTFTWNGTRIASVSDGGNPARTVSYGYDPAGDLVEVIDVAGGHATYGYDAQHRVTTMRSARHHGSTATPAPVTTNVYDAQGRVVTQTDPAGHTLGFDYTTVPGTTILTSPAGRRTAYAFQSGVPVSVTAGYGTPQASTRGFVYDPVTAQPTLMIDPLGRVTTVAYDARTHPTTVIDPLGRTTTATYNGYGQPLTVTDPTGTTTTLTYDPTGNPLTRSTPLRDPSGQPVLDGQGQPASATVTYTYSPTVPGQVASMIDARGKTWTYRYDGLGNLDQVTDPTGRKTVIVTDPVTGWSSSTIAPRGNEPGATPADYTTVIERNRFGDVTAITDHLGQRSETDYDPDRNVTASEDANGHRTISTYDPVGRVISLDRADGTTLANTLDVDGLLTAQIDGAGQATTYHYDVHGRQDWTRDPLGRQTSYAYDPAGQQTLVTDPSGRTTTVTYDQAGQAGSVDSSDPATPDITTITYDGNGRRTAMTQTRPGGAAETTSWAHDSLGRLTTSTDAPGGTITYGYDLGGNLTAIGYPGAGTVARGYDDAGRFTSTTDWLGQTSTFGYDADGNPTTTAFGTTGQTDTVTYDRTGQPTATTMTAPGSTLATLTYGRDPTGQVTAENHTGLPGPAATTYGYDPADRLTTRDGQAAWAYDNADNLTRLPTNSVLTSDTANQLTSLTQPAGVATFSSDNQGNRTGTRPPISTGRQAPTYGYDQQNRLVAASTPARGDVPVPGDYDGNGTTEIAVYRPTEQVWYIQGRLTPIQWGQDGDLPVPADYDGDGKTDIAVYRPADQTWYVQGVLATQLGLHGYIPVLGQSGGLSIQWGAPGDIPVPADYDGDGTADPAVFRPTDRTWYVQGGVTTQWGDNGDIPVPADYNGDGTTDIATYTPADQTWSSPGTGGINTQWGATGDIPVPADYDGDGDDDIAVFRLSDQTWSSQGAGGIATQWGQPGDFPVPADYDGNGTTEPAVYRPSTGTWQLKSTTPTSTSWGQPATIHTSTYTYDPTGLRATKTVDGATTSFTWDRAGSLPMLLAETTSGATTRYIYGPGGHPLAHIDPAGTTTWYHHDQLGSTRLTTNSAGAATSTTSYDPYGDIAAQTGTTPKLGYAGQYTEPETGLQYLRARYYDPSTAQFLTRDPIEATTREPYSYARNNPLNLTDPSGLCPEQCPSWLTRTAGFLGYRSLLSATDKALNGDFTGAGRALIDAGPTYAEELSKRTWEAVAKRTAGVVGRATGLAAKTVATTFLFPIGIAATMIDYACDLDEAG